MLGTVHAQTSEKIPQAEADGLIVDAQEIIDLLTSPSSRHGLTTGKGPVHSPDPFLFSFCLSNSAPRRSLGPYPVSPCSRPFYFPKLVIDSDTWNASQACTMVGWSTNISMRLTPVHVHMRTWLSLTSHPRISPSGSGYADQSCLNCR